MTVRLSRPRILIVDDAPANIRILAEALRTDYEITFAINGEEALRLIESEDPPPDLILLDIIMPGMDGYEVCKRLKAAEETWNIPVIFITSKSEEEEEKKGFELGAVDYITKPFNTAIVKARVRPQLELKKYRDHLEDLVKVRTAELIAANELLRLEINARKQAEEALWKAHDELEERVEKRTAELLHANALLKQEIAERKRAEEAYKNLLAKQEINIDLAKKILSLVNGTSPRYIDLTDELELFIDVLYAPCHAEGGDHYFVKDCGPDRQDGYKGVVISLKDQSGHEVGCVLRSIITDLFHNAVLCRSDASPLEEILSRLNDEICHSGLFEEDDFFTSINIEIDPETLLLRYVSTGHPPFLLIRGEKIRSLPEPGAPGTNLPIALSSGMAYSVGECQLREGDKLIFYTDGLVEMPLKHLGKVLTIKDLEKIAGDIVHGDSKLPASEVMNEILDTVSGMSREEVFPFLKNTSGDDVTMICLEVEKRSNYEQQIWTPLNCNHITEQVTALSEKLALEWKQRGYESPELRIRMVLEEAVLNAWIHGNKQNPNKEICIRWRYGNDFHLEVIDEGEGFDDRLLPDPTSNENLTKPFGRGIFIIRYFADAVRWKEGGRHIVVTLRKQSRPAREEYARRAKRGTRL